MDEDSPQALAICRLALAGFGWARSWKRSPTTVSRVIGVVANRPCSGLVSRVADAFAPASGRVLQFASRALQVRGIRSLARGLVEDDDEADDLPFSHAEIVG